jgi:signal peptidase I
MKYFRRFIIIFIVGIVITIIIKVFFIQLYTIDSDSMNKSIELNDRIIATKFFSVKRNDIVIYQNEKEESAISRILAIEDDTVQISGQKIFINSKEVSFEKQLNSYLLRFINQKANDSLRTKYILNELGNSAMFVILLSQGEYESIMNDTVSELKSHLFSYSLLDTNLFYEPNSFEQFIVGKDSVFLLNDNRANLNDSRRFGSVPLSALKAKMIKQI